ncbi:class I adenylate-forming enzyme family protein [Microbacterium sp. ZW T5_56]|uniref:class I adenylate-forming enzyme family protein n=1 Tax=Microbacterium sp. ZW T5_56 TaxID=3378081 RepID=UPI003852101B
MHLSTLPDERAATAPEAPAIRDDASELSNRVLLDRVRRAAGALAARGVSRGDVVAILLPNRVELIVALFAAWRVGAAVTPINPVLGVTEVRHQVADSGARVIVSDTDLGLDLDQIGLDDLDGDADDASDPRDLGDEQLALLIYTSGTTGTPKGVMLSHRNLDAMTSSFISWFELGADDHSLLVLPLFHANGIVLGTLSPLRAGGQVSITGRFARDRFFADVERLRPTYFSAVPAIYALLSSLDDSVQPDTSSLRFAVCGAAPMPAEAITRFEQRFGVTIVEGYGLSETTTASTINPLRGVRKPGTVGLPLPDQRVAIMDEQGELLPPGGVGEIVIAGPVVMTGYLGRPEETARTIVDGWLHTGDIGRFDADGYLQIVDRIKDMIIRGGENIYPQEIENALYAHPDVVEAAVIGAPDPVLGEVPVAYVAVRDGAVVSPADLAERMAETLAAFKRPQRVLLLPELPKNPVGKIDKPALRRRLADAS